MTLLDYAIAYARRGWPVHPLKPMSKDPATEHGLLDATTNEDTIRTWWSKNPNYNIGLRTGVNWWVLDVDTKHPEAAEWLDSVTIPNTFTQVTGTDGKHFLFRVADFEIRNSAGKVSKYVDVRGAGGYIVAAPSIHPDTGKAYFWDDPETVPLGIPADAPGWLLERLREPAESTPYVEPAVINEGGRNDTLYRGACSFRSKVSASNDEVWAWLVAMNGRCKPPLPESELRTLHGSVCKNAPGLSPEYQSKVRTPTPTQEPFIDSPPLDVDSIIQSSPESSVLMAMAAELAELDETQFQILKIKAKAKFGATFSGTALEKAVVSERKKSAPPPSDDEIPPNDIALQILAKNDILNVDDTLYCYDGTKWDMTSTSYLKHLALKADGESLSSKNRREEIASFIASKIYKREHTWRNIEMYEVPVANGVINLKTMKVRPHRKEDYLQTCIPWDFDKTAQCPTLMACLDTYFGGDDDEQAKKDALQEFFGYCLMPHAKYKKALFCEGESDCGKSTIPFLLRALLGTSNIAGVSVDQMDDARKRAPLLGKLVNLLTELTFDAMIADGGFKTLVSTEEPILFDPKHLTPILDIPICKHVFAMNKLPRINDRSNATFNRILLIKFLHIIPAKDQDRAIWDKLKDEIHGILLWAIEGAQRLYNNGGTFTSVGVAEMREYRSEQDPLGGFIEDFYDIDKDSKVAVPDFVDLYKKQNNNKASPQAICQMIRSAGYTISKNAVFFPGKRRTRAVYGIKERKAQVTESD